MDAVLEARIRERAYALWVENGREEGRADDFWYRAEREIRDEGGQDAAADDSVFTVADSEMLSGVSDSGGAPGGPTVAALGAAPATPVKARGAAAKGARPPQAKREQKTT